MSYVYMIIADPGTLPMITPPEYGFTYFKVGMSHNPWSRVAEMQTGNPMQLSVYRTWKFDNQEIVRKIERLFRENNSSGSIRGEWFCDDPQGDWDTLSTTICLYAFEKLRLSGEPLLHFMTKTGMGAEIARDVILSILHEEEAALP